MLDAARIAAAQRTYGLTYHVPYAADAERSVGFAGKTVLEVGGNLPRGFVLDTLETRRWVAIQELKYYEALAPTASRGVNLGTEKTIPMEAVRGPEDLADYTVILGGIEAIPTGLHGHFDLIFSIAAFEHILDLGAALAAMWAALKPGGVLFSQFSPIWSAHDGHHIPTIVDAHGRTFDFSSSPIPPWGHLLMRPPQMHSHLLQHTDPATASKLVHYTYHSPHINRLLCDDFVAYIRSVPFRGEVRKMFPRPVPEATLATLKRLHPTNSHFDNNGLRLVLRKPE